MKIAMVSADSLQLLEGGPNLLYKSNYNMRIKVIIFLIQKIIERLTFN
jgi:hypothetical protein